jgi:hypothetical protein
VTLCDLLFILLFLSSVVACIVILILLATGRRAAAGKALLGAGAVWCVYLAVLAGSELMAQPQTMAPGQDRCFDEMCFAVVRAQSSPSPGARGANRRLYVVTIRITSRSRGRAQSEGGLRARLYDHGTYFDVSPQAQGVYELDHGKSPMLTQRLAPGESVQSVLVFEVPGNIAHPGLTLDHGFTPGYFVIGESPFFHGPDILTLPQD